LVIDLEQLRVKPTQISCGGFHTAVLSMTGEVYLWGRNTYGQCGRSPNGNISSQFLFGPVKLHLETQKTFKHIDCGD